MEQLNNAKEDPMLRKLKGLEKTLAKEKKANRQKC